MIEILLQLHNLYTYRKGIPNWSVYEEVNYNAKIKITKTKTMMQMTINNELAV